MVERKLLVTAPLGLHARAAARLVRVANEFQSKVQLRRVDGGQSSASVDAKSILSVLMLAATRGTLLLASSEGIDELRAMEAIENLFAEGFEEAFPGSSK